MSNINTIIEVSKLSSTQLQELMAQVQEEQTKRRNRRYNELVSNVMNALHQLKSEYPHSTCIIDVDVDDCTTEIDVLDIISTDCFAQ